MQFTISMLARRWQNGLSNLSVQLHKKKVTVHKLVGQSLFVSCTQVLIVNLITLISAVSHVGRFDSYSRNSAR